MSKKKTKEEFIQEARKVHGNKYNYSKVEYANSHVKVCIICLAHGEFWQTPDNHLHVHGCPFCGKRFDYDTESFIGKAAKVHKNKYDYSKVKYVTNKNKVCIICYKHGEFWKRADKHLQGQGCPKCAIEESHEKQKLSIEEFIERAKKIHGDKYDYSKVEYINSNIKVCIICPTHGEFWQRPIDHLNGCGCWKCRQSVLEKNILEKLLENDIKYEYNSFPSFLNGLQLDFYFPQYNIAIECQGIQHFVENHFYEPLEVVQERDKRKRKLCEENGVKLLYYSNLGIEYPYEVFEDKDKLFEEILKYGDS